MRGFFYALEVLLFTCVLASLLVVDAGLAAIACRAAYAVHGATETNRAIRLVFFEEAAGAGAEIVGAIIPATTLDDAGFVADKGRLTITIGDALDGGVTVEVVDDITLLVVTAGLALGIGDIAGLDPA